MPRFKTIAFLIAAAILGTAGGGWLLYIDGHAAIPPAPAAPVAAVPVEIAPVRMAVLAETLSTVGSLRAAESVTVAAEIAGRIVEIGFAEGGAVAKDAILVRLDTSILEAQADQAEATLTLTRATYDRTQALAQSGTSSAQTQDQDLADLRVAEAAAALAKAELEKATIRAPFAGMAGLRSVSVGHYVQAGTELVRLDQTDPIKVDFSLPEIALGQIAVGQPITVTLDALPGESFTGEVYAIDPAVAVSGRSIQLRASLPNPDGRLHPGLFARVSLTVREIPQALMIPESAVVPTGAQQTVFRIGADGRAEAVEVQLGLRRPGEVQVTDGLSAGDRVVSAGQQRLAPGAAVREATVASAE